MVASTSSAPTIVVFGSTGNQGGSVVDHLLASPKPYHIKAVTRDPTSQNAKTLQGKGVEIVQAEFGDVGSLDAVVKGADYVFLVTNTAAAGPQAELEHGKNVVDASKKAGIKTLYWSGLPGVNKITGGKLAIAGFDVKAEITEYAKEKGVPYVDVQAGGYMETWGVWSPIQKLDDGTYLISSHINPSTRYPILHTRRDYGAWVVGAIEKGVPSGTTVYTATQWATGPEMAEELGEHFGKKVTWKSVSREELQQIIPPPLGAFFADMTEFMNDYGYYNGNDTRLSDSLPQVKLQTFKEYIASPEYVGKKNFE